MHCPRPFCVDFYFSRSNTRTGTCFDIVVGCHRLPLPLSVVQERLPPPVRLVQYALLATKERTTKPQHDACFNLIDVFPDSGPYKTELLPWWHRRCRKLPPRRRRQRSRSWSLSSHRTTPITTLPLHHRSV